MFIILTQNFTKRSDRVVSTPAWYSEGAKFKSDGVFVDFLSASTQMRV